MTDAAFDIEADRGVRDVVAASGSTFVHGMRILSPPRRQAIFAVYAFCRVVDDIVDGPASPARKRAGLDLWDREIAAVFAGAPQTAIGRELRRAADGYDLPEREFHLILEGMWMDVTPVVAPDRETLEAYVRRVAGAVGMLSMRIFGAWRGAPSRDFALSLARGMQFTNILRDVEEDAMLGRVYLPRDILETAGVTPDPARIAADPNLPLARRALGRDARAAFRDACAAVPAHPRLRLTPAFLMMGPYERLLAGMELDWHRPAPRRPGWRKAVDGLVCLARGGAS